MVNIKEKLNDGWLHAKVIIEIMGKPKEHVEKTMKEYLEKIKKEEELIVIKEDVAEAKEQKTGVKEKGLIEEMWVTFAELEMLFKTPVALTYFCFDYMPSLIEILAPDKLSFDAVELSSFFNDLQAKLLQVNMVVKQLQNQTVFLNQNLKTLLENFLKSILKDGKEFTSEDLVKVMGVGKNVLEDLLDVWVDEGKVEMNGDKYKAKGKK
ncbi:hypothetical protein ACFLZB_01430 [Nanoarchaeota archaeon]